MFDSEARIRGYNRDLDIATFDFSGVDLGGMSGGPILLPQETEEGLWHRCLGGVNCEARSSTDFETVVAVRAHFINPDGSISRI